MTRSELIDRLGRHFPQRTRSDTQLAVSFMLLAMARALIGGRRIEIRHFGSLSASKRPARTGRNPKTGASIAVPPKRSIRWKAGKEMNARLNPGQLPRISGAGS